MVTFKQKMDSCGKIYIVKPLRQMGLVNTIEIVPNAKAAVIYRAGTEPSEIIASLQVIIADLKHREKCKQKRTLKLTPEKLFQSRGEGKWVTLWRLLLRKGKL